MEISQNFYVLRYCCRLESQLIFFYFLIFFSFFSSSLMPTEEEEIAGKAKLCAAKLNEAFKVAAISVLWDLML